MGFVHVLRPVLPGPPWIFAMETPARCLASMRRRPATVEREEQRRGSSTKEADQLYKRSRLDGSAQSLL